MRVPNISSVRLMGAERPGDHMQRGARRTWVKAPHFPTKSDPAKSTLDSSRRADCGRLVARRQNIFMESAAARLDGALSVLVGGGPVNRPVPDHETGFGLPARVRGSRA